MLRWRDRKEVSKRNEKIFTYILSMDRLQIFFAMARQMIAEYAAQENIKDICLG